MSDQVGTLGMTLDDAGSTLETSLKDAWGVPMAGGSSDRYSGIAQREIDTESGLTFMRHRMYDPRLGRFTQTDPLVGNRPTQHYAYAGNNPISRTDPSGERWIVPQGPGTKGMLADLQKYTARHIDVSSSGIATFGMALWGEEFASKADLEWIRRVESDDSQTDITSLWIHVVNGDEWHRKQFGRAYVANTVGEYNPATEAAKQGNSWGIYQAPAEYQDDPAFIVGVWSWRVAQVAAAIATGGAAAGGGATAATTSTTAATVTTAAAGSAPALGFTAKLLQGNQRFGLEHIAYKHWFSSGVGNASRFSQALSNVFKLKDLIQEAIQKGTAWRVEGAKRVLDVNMGRVLGTDRSGNPAEWLRIVVNEAGEIITTFPFAP